MCVVVPYHLQCLMPFPGSGPLRYLNDNLKQNFVLAAPSKPDIQVARIAETVYVPNDSEKL
jgi:hypothetical protein